MFDMVIISRDQGEDGSISAEVRVPSGSDWFDGHFPGCPVLPGIAQLCVVYDIIRQSLQSTVRVSEVNNIRFKQMIVPGDYLIVKAELRSEGGRYAFRITRADEIVCMGSMTIAIV